MKLSASSVELFAGPDATGEDACERKWWAKRILKLPWPQGEKAKLGTRAHAITGEYLKKGTPPNRAEQMTIIVKGSPKTFYPGRIAANIFHHLPAAGSVERIEEQLDFTYKGFDVIGYVDHQDATTVGDLKFTTSLEHAKDEAKLRKDVQRTFYTTGRFLESDDREVVAQWTYGTFDAKSSKKVRLPVVRADSLASMDRLLPVFERMARTAEETDGHRVKANVCKETCQAFNEPCPALDWCKPSAGARLVSVTKNVTKIDRSRSFMPSDALERLRAKRALAAATTPATETVAPAAAAAVAADMKAISDAQAGQINPPGEAVAPPPNPKDEKEAAAALKKPKGRKAANADKAAETPSDDTRASEAIAAHNELADVKLATLYVDCFPVKCSSHELELVEASKLIAEANEIVARETAAPHYALIDYGKGRGALHVALKFVIDSRDKPFNVVLNTRSTASMDAIQALSEAAYVIVRGAA